MKPIYNKGLVDSFILKYIFILIFLLTYNFNSWGSNIALSYSLTLGASSATVSSEAGSGTTIVTSTANSLAVSSSASWLIGTIAYNSTSGLGKLTYSYSTYSPTSVIASSRQAIITITTDAGNSITFTVTQKAPDYLVVTNQIGDLDYGSGSGTLGTVQSNISWTVSSSQSWLTPTVQYTSGSSGNGSITIVYTANTSTVDRSSTITVTGGSLSRTITVTQKAIPYVSASISSLTLSYLLGNGSFNLSSNCEWGISCSSDWLSLEVDSNGGTDGEGNDIVNYSYSTYGSSVYPYEPRTATITISPMQDGLLLKGISPYSIQVTQNAMPCILITSTPSNLSYTVTTATVSISSNISWSVVSSSSWLSATQVYNSGSSGSGTVNLQLTSNTSTTSRTATLTITGGGITKTVTITQKGWPYISIDSNVLSFSIDEGVGSLYVSSNCKWSVISSASWLTVSGSYSSVDGGNGTISYSYDKNESLQARSATITISANDVTNVVINVTQAGMPYPIIISEYIEGSNYNKAIELYNNYDKALDLSTVVLKKDLNGDGKFADELTLSGTLAAHGTYVICNNKACNDILKKSQLTTTSSVMEFNGDDQLELVYNDNVVDRIGISGDINFGLDKTMLRLPSIETGSTKESNASTDGNWLVLEEDCFSFLGYHYLDGDLSYPYLFFSEYIEGSGYNKGLELYNSGLKKIDLQDVAILKQTNGSGSYSGSSLRGALASGKTFAIAHTGAEVSLLKKSDLLVSGGYMDYNGNDPLILVYKGIIIDVIGKAGGSNFALDKGLVRIPSVTRPTGAYSATEWGTLTKDDFSNFGWHNHVNQNRLTLTSEQNYILTQNPLIPMTEDAFVNTTTDVLTQVSYFDGLGRPIQEQQVAQSPNYNDIVTFHIYDDLGREAVEYLPFSGNYNGAYTTGFIGEAEGLVFDFYANPSDNNISIAADDYPLAVTVFDNSPLNRVMKQGAPGEDWQPDESTTDRDISAENIVSYDYASNSSDEIFLLTVGTDGALIKEGYYDAGKLYVTQTTDENGNVTKEYKDFEGKVILKLSENGSSNIYTYYAYDKFGLLRYVLPPKSYSSLNSLAINSAVSVSTTWVNQLAYYYLYDGRKRMVEKKLPGAEPVLMVYDDRDRLVLTQDGVQRLKPNEWSFTKYDDLNRPCVTGTVVLTGTELLIRSTYASIDLSKVSHDLTVDYNPLFSSTGGVTYNNIVVLAKTYFDNYNYPGHMAFNEDYCIGISDNDDGWNANVKGLVAGTKTRVGEGEHWEEQTNFYDDNYRLIFVNKIIDIGDTRSVIEYSSAHYNFIGSPLEEQLAQNFNGTWYITKKVNSYDHAQRLIQTDFKVDGQTGWNTTAALEYDELGQLKQKVLGSDLQAVDFKYNIRGWLTDINDVDNIGADKFALKLAYNDQIFYEPFSLVSGGSVVSTSSSLASSIPGGTYVFGIGEASYNGNISGMHWISPDSDLKMSSQAYGFTYDNLNRLVTADYFSGDDLTASDDYKVANITYDLNGNIMSLQRFDADLGEIDNLAYNYSGNQLIKVTDSGLLTNGFKSTTTAQALTTQYTYDNNGNMLTDQNKAITSNITYNQLNLPTLVTTNGNTVSYLYNAAGVKYKRTTSDGNGNRYYFSNFEYDKNMKLEYIHTSEGRIRVQDSYTYDYYLKDHLGNTRVVVSANRTSTPVVQQVSNYYPFGMRFNQGNTVANQTTNYMYNGKEFQEDLEWYDYGFRMYDPALGRWHNPDLLGELYFSYSPYGYVLNSPINYTDPYGLWVKGAGILNNIFKKDVRNEAEMKAKELNKTDGVSDVHVEKTYKNVYRVTWVENNSDSKGSDVALNGVGFCDFTQQHKVRKQTKVEKGLEAADDKLSSLLDNYRDSKVGDKVRKADDFANKVTPVVAKVLPPTALVDAGKTITTGYDINQTKQEGTLNRYVLPSVSIALILAPVLNELGLTNLSDATIKNINVASKVMDAYTVGTEVERQIKDE